MKKRIKFILEKIDKYIMKPVLYLIAGIITYYYYCFLILLLLDALEINIFNIVVISLAIIVPLSFLYQKKNIM